MKIAYIANARIPSRKAHGIQIMKMCEAFSLKGYEVTLIVPNRKTGIKITPFEYYGVEKIFKIKKLPTIDTVPFGKIGFFIHQLTFSIVSAAYILSSKFDIAYARDERSLYFLSFFTRKITWESHMARYTIMAKKILEKGCRLVVITNSLKRFYVDKGIPEGQILVAHDAVNLEEFSVRVNKIAARKSLGLQNDKKVVMYIGALKKWKGYETLLKAQSLLGNEWQVVIIGGSDKDINFLSKKYPRVIFLGSKPYKDLPINQCAADVLVVPNIVTQDPFELHTSPLKVFAHMTSGIPIIASNVAPLREILSEKNAVIFQPGNEKDLAKKIIWADQNKEEVNNRSNQALLDVKAYSWKERAESIIKHIIF